jgi:hypothetical protein
VCLFSPPKWENRLQIMTVKYNKSKKQCQQLSIIIEVVLGTKLNQENSKEAIKCQIFYFQCI